MKENENQDSNKKKPLLQENGNQGPVIQPIESISEEKKDSESISEEKKDSNLNNKEEIPEIQYSNRHSNKPPLSLKQFSSKFNSSVKNLLSFGEEKESTAEKRNTPNSNILRPVDNTLTEEQYRELFTSLIKNINILTRYKTFNNTFGEESDIADQLKISIEQTLEAINFTENEVDSIIICMKDKMKEINNTPYEISLNNQGRFPRKVLEGLSETFSKYLGNKPDYDDVQFQLMSKKGYTQMKIGQIKTLLESSGGKEEKMEENDAGKLMNGFLTAIKTGKFKDFLSTLKKSQDISPEVKKIFTKDNKQSPVTQLVKYAKESNAIRIAIEQHINLENKVYRV